MRRHLPATVTVLAVLLTGCTVTPTPPSAPTAAPTPTGPVRVAAPALPDDYDPTDSTDPYLIRIAGLLQRGLFRYDAKGKAVPEVAESVTTEDDRVFTVVLADGWRFSNGEPVTADSFVDAWSRAADPDHPRLRRDLFAPIDGFVSVRHERTGPGRSGDAVTTDPTRPDGRSPRLPGLSVRDSRTFTITLTHPQPEFPQRLAHVAFAPLPDVAFTDPEGYRRAPIGNGPYALQGAWSSTGPVRLRPDPTYTATVPARNAGLEFRVHTDPAVALGEFEAGRLDVLDVLPAAALQDYRATYGERAVNQPIGSVLDIVFPTTTPPWDGPAGVARRTAISMAVDRESLARDVLSGTAAPATDLATPVIQGHSRELCGPACRLDPDEARDTLSGAGGLPEPVTLAYARDVGLGPTAQAVCADLRTNLGVPCTPRPHATTHDLARAVASGAETGPYLARYQMDYPLLENFLLPRFSPGLATNRSGYTDPEAASALARAARAPQDERTSRWQSAEALVLDDMPVVPLLDLNATTVWSPMVTDVRIDVFGAPDHAAIRRP